MIHNINNSIQDLNTNKSIKKNNEEQDNKPENNKFKRYLSDYVPMYTGEEGIAKKYNYK